MNSYKLVLISLFMTIGLNGCGNKENIYDKIKTEIESKERSHDEKNKIYMTDFTAFEWDYMYIFNEYASLSDVERVTKLKINGSLEFVRRMIFVKGDNIVLYEEQLMPVSDVPKGIVKFKFENSNYFKIFSNNAIFTYERKDEGTLYYYELRFLT